MAKLEELATLLVDEINDFKVSVEKLEKINNQIGKTKIKMDVSEYKNIIKEHQLQMQSHLNGIESFEIRFNNKIKDAKIYPTWAVVVFVANILFGVISILCYFLL